MEQIDRNCLAPDGSLLSKSAFLDLHQAKEEMLKERARYLEAIGVDCEARAMVEEYQQALIGGLGFNNLNLDCPSQVYESLEHHLILSEAAQRLRLPQIQIQNQNQVQNQDETSSRSSFDSTTISPSSNSNFHNTNSTLSVTSSSTYNNNGNLGSDVAQDDAVFGVANRFLGVNYEYLYQSQEDKPIMCVDMSEYQRPLVREIEARLERKCDLLDTIFASDDTDSSSIHQMSSARLPERVKLIIEEIEKEEANLLDDLSSMDRKFTEHYSVLEQILSVLVKFVKELKLQHQYQFDEMRKIWLCKRCQTMHAKLSVLEKLLLRDTYTKDSVPALHRIRKYLEDATEEASIQYNNAVTRLQEYQGVDPYFDNIARKYNEIVKKLEYMHWTINQVEDDLKSKNS